MKFETAFEPGDELYTLGIRNSRVTIDCEYCSGQGFLPYGSKIECRMCNTIGSNSVYRREWIVASDKVVVDGIVIDFYGLVTRINYTIGSNKNNILEEDLFYTIEEAQEEADRRNLNGEFE